MKNKAAIADYSDSSESSSSPLRNRKSKSRGNIRIRSRSKSKPNHHRNLPYNNKNYREDYPRRGQNTNFRRGRKFNRHNRNKDDKFMDVLEKEKESDEYDQWLIKEDEFLKKQMIEQ